MVYIHEDFLEFRMSNSHFIINQPVVVGQRNQRPKLHFPGSGNTAPYRRTIIY